MPAKDEKKRPGAADLAGEYCCTYAEEAGRAIPGVGGTLRIRVRGQSSGRYELVFLCQGSEEVEKGTFIVKGDLIDFKIKESNYPAGPVEGAKARFRIDGRTLILLYVEPETNQALSAQRWERTGD